MAWGERDGPLALHQTARPGTNGLLVLLGKRQDIDQRVLRQVAAGLKGNLVYDMGNHLAGAGQQADRQAMKGRRAVGYASGDAAGRAASRASPITAATSCSSCRVYDRASKGRAMPAIGPDTSNACRTRDPPPSTGWTS